MPLLFDPEPPFVRWCAVDGGRYAEHRTTASGDWPKDVFDGLGKSQKVEAVGYLLYHGGEEVREPVSILSEELLAKMERSVIHAPDANEMTLRLVRLWSERLPDIPHLVCCDTAFFATLPARASTYAVPYELRSRGMKRYGGYGLYHQWAWEHIRMQDSVHAEKLLSIFLGNHPNIAAIEHGAAVETSLGFTPVEGIPSSTTSGDIDPTIIFQLLSRGMALEEINLMLSRESGFTGLAGKVTTFSDLMKGWDEPEMVMARENLRYNVLKYAGALIAVAGGVDTIVFLTDHTGKPERFITEICHGLEFLGTKCTVSPHTIQNGGKLSDADSSIGVSWLRCNKWEILVHMLTTLKNQEA